MKVTFELFSDSNEYFLDGGGIPEESSTDLDPTRRYVANCCLDIIWNPFDEIRWILVLNI